MWCLFDHKSARKNISYRGYGEGMKLGLGCCFLNSDFLFLEEVQFIPSMVFWLGLRLGRENLLLEGGDEGREVLGWVLFVGLEKGEDVVE
ncbi:hypothetical protein MRB53_026691 [Persea americana]|uniref:Uncharacterized protein n=1 Tax=Persea americana TaxID=3435 RepID=A0ACC2LJ29_PERAE|nr:hypothetical protein MRB53_026691 [Persea americana]